MLTHDLGRIWEDQWRPKNGPRGLTLDEFYSLTPAAMFRMFFRARPDPNKTPPDQDAVALLRNINIHRASIGQPPATPAWFLKEVPRHGR